MNTTDELRLSHLFLSYINIELQISGNAVVSADFETAPITRFLNFFGKDHTTTNIK
jgi:hypothetical protein